MDRGGPTIRLALSDDAPSIAALYVQAAEEARDREPTHFQRPDPKVVEEHYADLAPSQDRLLLVAETAGGVVGFVEARRITPFAGSDWRMIEPRIGAYVEELAVDRASRGHGIGRALVEAVEGWAREFGGRLVMLDTGTRNTAAQAFYDRIGYRQIGVVLIRELDEEPPAR